MRSWHICSHLKCVIMVIIEEELIINYCFFAITLHRIMFLYSNIHSRSKNQLLLCKLLQCAWTVSYKVELLKTNLIFITLVHYFFNSFFVVTSKICLKMYLFGANSVKVCNSNNLYSSSLLRSERKWWRAKKKKRILQVSLK